MAPELISIGKLAKATGFSVERLRIWELRYGKPLGERRPSGHRRYPAEEVERLHLVREALARGQRPRQVVALGRAQLLSLLERQGSSAAVEAAPTQALPWSPKAWVRAAAAMDESGLDRQFYQAWLDLGSLRFLRERAEPFIHALGDEWQKGEICVAEEHFGSEKIGDFIAGIWRRLNEHNEAGPVLLSTLPGDAHRLGLQMAALVSAMAGLKVIYLGPSTPLDEVARVAGRVSAKAVLYSVALGVDGVRAREELRALKQQLGPGVSLGVGGAGAPLQAAGEARSWLRFSDLQSYYAWARGLSGAKAADAPMDEARP